MRRDEVVWVKCTFVKSPYASRRTFRIPATPGRVFVGTASEDYCFEEDHVTPLRGPEIGEELPGWVLGVRLDVATTNGKQVIHLPDGENYELDPKLILTQEKANVSV